MKTITQTSLDRRLSRIREMSEKLEAIKTAEKHLTTRLYSETYVYIEAVVAAQIVPNVQTAVKALADTLKRKWIYVRTWYYMGAFMRKEGVDPKKTTGPSVQIVYQAINRVPTAERHKLIQGLKDGLNSGALAKIARQGKRKTGSEQLERAKRILKDGGLRREVMEMEMLACLTIIKGYFKKEGTLTFTDSEGKVLMQVGKGKK